MNLVLAARADHDAHRHTDSDVGCVSIDNVGREFWAFFQRDVIRARLRLEQKAAEEE